MNMLSFLDVAPQQAILISLVCCLAISLQSFTGRLFLKGYGLFTQAVAALSFHAAVTTILISYAAALAKTYILGTIVFALILSLVVLCRAIFVTKNILSSIKSLRPSGILMVISFLLINLMLVLFYLHDLNQGGTDGILFNAHQNYFSGVSLEIFQADYLGRLRIFDNYPVTWAK